ncbi:hypothetical protein L227DRAFT_581663 [Lentinus tigrinus ALCF2SS1-6]|uniref:Uncharacterized protein n=1 Tax=Lentinus tigrinus ALCF2SS1-6 TaxID=1328759 RepID=A0A5C2RP31_9APHY|nr:hypothetical protein L227DRAFT_581663 [Lentinus tigrinus ALCF2SS1-6]
MRPGGEPCHLCPSGQTAVGQKKLSELLSERTPMAHEARLRISSFMSAPAKAVRGA